MEDLDVNTSMWRIFMTDTLRAAVHLGNDYVEKLFSTNNQSKRTLKQFYNVTEKLVKDQDGIQGISVINWHTDKAVQLSNAHCIALIMS